VTEQTPGPLALWTAILAGPAIFACDLTVSYALVKPACVAFGRTPLHAISVMSFVLVASGALFAWRLRQALPANVCTTGSDPERRAHFMATLGLWSSMFFLVIVIALAIPRWVLDGCR
jgi:hypothetical protein